MRNAQGGKIAEGNWLLWCIREETFKAMGGRLLLRVAKVNESLIEGNPSPPSITFVFDMPIDIQKLPRGQEPQLSDFYGLTNPSEEQALENILKN